MQSCWHGDDPIVNEVREARDAYAKRFNYDLDAIYRDLKMKERKSGKTVIACPVKQESDASAHPVQNGKSV